MIVPLFAGGGKIEFIEKPVPEPAWPRRGGRAPLCPRGSARCASPKQPLNRLKLAAAFPAPANPSQIR
jgi:hypothetical protein